MTFLAALLLASAVTLPRIEPAKVIDLSAQGQFASDVAWLNDDELLVTLMKGGVARVSTSTGKSSTWLPQGPMPAGAPYPEFIATDGGVVAIVGGGSAHVMFRAADGKFISGYSSGPLKPRGVAVSGGKAFLMGWLTQGGTTADQQRGALFVRGPDEALDQTPIHGVASSDESLNRWRLTMSQYAGATVALPDGTLAIVTTAEPGVFHYDSEGKLLGVLATSIDSLIMDSALLVRFAADLEGRYRQVINPIPMIDDLVAAPAGLAILVRTATANDVGWELWTVGPRDVTSRQPLGFRRLGPFGHMKCEARGTRLACVANAPDAKDASKIATSGTNPRLILFKLPKAR